MPTLTKIPKGIFINGKPLEIFLGEEKRKEVREEIIEVVAWHKKNIPKKLKFKSVSAFCRNGKVRHLTTEEIKKEYGVMAVKGAVKIIVCSVDVNIKISFGR